MQVPDVLRMHRSSWILAAIVALATYASTGPASATATAPPVMTASTQTSYVVDGRSVTMVCTGSGRVPVVFQAGGNDPGAYWDGLIAALGPNVLACVFDRPGVAPSAPSPTLLSPRSVSKTLASVLKQASLGPRVVLVGHSIGGLNALVFGATHPQEVAGAVLFDPSEAKFFEATNAGAILTSYGYDQTGVNSQIRAVTRWPNVPLAILSRDPAKAVADGQATAAQEQIWTAGAIRYARLSSKGSRTVVPGATHYVYLDAPDVALSAIRRVLQQAA